MIDVLAFPRKQKPHFCFFKRKDLLTDRSFTNILSQILLTALCF